MRLPKWRKMTWAIHVVNGIFLLWIIGGIASRPSKTCVADAYLSKADCADFSDAGTAIGVGLIIFFWFMVFVVMSLVWFMTRPRDSKSNESLA